MFEAITSNDGFTNTYTPKKRKHLFLKEKQNFASFKEGIKRKHAVVGWLFILHATILIRCHTSLFLFFKPECLCVPKPTVIQ